jgi:FAD/FMN-containing dehydrogenase
MATTSRMDSELRTLSALSSGSVVTAADEGWDDARHAWNLAADQHPAAVVFPETETDVAFAVAFAREAGLRVNVQGTGHNPLPLGDMSGTLLIRTTRMNKVDIDVRGRRARVQPGTIWSDVSAPASEHGLAALVGSSPDVGITGYSLGGGIGYIGRKYGIQTNSVTAIELITAEGEHTRVDADHDPELFWALRGGGGNFGVVTALEFKLYPVDALYGGMLAWPWEQSEAVLSRWADWTAGAPDEITSMLRLMQIPPIPEAPEIMRGRNLVVVSAAVLGSAAEGDALLAPMRELKPEIDMFAEMPPVGLSYLHGDPETPVPVLSDTGMVDGLPAEAISAFVETAGPGSGSSLMMAELRQMGGEFGRARDGAGALARIDAEYVVFAGGMVMDAESAAAIERDSRQLMEAMAPYGRGGKYLNFAERAIDTAAAYPEDVYARLRAVRASVDPDGLFRSNHEIG